MTTAVQPIRIAVIGAGTISQSVHLPSLHRAGYEIAVVCDLSPSRATEVAARFGARATTSPAEAFADPAVEAVLIATPGSHAELALAAIRAGKHVLAEKPLAFSIGEVDELIAAADEAGVVAQVGYMKMYDPLTARARTELAELADIRLVRITVAHPDDLPQIAHLRMDPPLADAAPDAISAAVAYEDARSRAALPGASDVVLSYYRNVINGSVIHELSLMRAMGLELPLNWTADVFPTLDGPAPACLLATASVGDTRYVLSWNWLPEFPEYDEELKVLASNGRLEYHLAKPYLLEERSRLRVERNVALERQDTTYTEGFETGFLRQLDAFAASIRTGAPVLADLAGARLDIAAAQSLAVAVAATRGESITPEYLTRA